MLVVNLRRAHQRPPFYTRAATVMSKIRACCADIRPQEDIPKGDGDDNISPAIGPSRWRLRNAFPARTYQDEVVSRSRGEQHEDVAGERQVNKAKRSGSAYSPWKNRQPWRRFCPWHAKAKTLNGDRISILGG